MNLGALFRRFGKSLASYWPELLIVGVPLGAGLALLLMWPPEGSQVEILSYHAAQIGYLLIGTALTVVLVEILLGGKVASQTERKAYYPLRDLEQALGVVLSRGLEILRPILREGIEPEELLNPPASDGKATEFFHARSRRLLSVASLEALRERRMQLRTFFRDAVPFLGLARAEQLHGARIAEELRWSQLTTALDEKKTDPEHMVEYVRAVHAFSLVVRKISSKLVR